MQCEHDAALRLLLGETIRSHFGTGPVSTCRYNMLNRVTQPIEQYCIKPGFRQIVTRLWNRMIQACFDFIIIYLSFLICESLPTKRLMRMYTRSFLFHKLEPVTVILILTKRLLQATACFDFCDFTIALQSKGGFPLFAETTRSELAITR